MNENMEEKKGIRTILVVDDTVENIDVLSGVLRKKYKIKVALNGEKALKIVNADPKISMILLDIMMPGIDGYEVCRQLKQNPLTAPIPVIFITAMCQEEDERVGLELGAVDYITKPFSPSIVEARVRTHLALYDQNLALEHLVKVRTAELLETRLQIVHRLGRAAEFRDNETGLHVIRMSHYARLIAKELDYGETWTELIFNAAPMHDIGKIGIPDKILLKKGPLTDEEWSIMRKHPEYGVEIIGDNSSDILMTAKEIALTHHEKWDGSGYPRMLKGEEIPISGRIIAIADVFDALTTKRPYKEAWSVEDAVKLMNDHSGSHFDPNLISLFNKVLPSILEIKQKYDESTAK
jgi:putative two-component system response regulator